MPIDLYNVPSSASKIYLHTGNMLCFSSLINKVHLKNDEQIVEGLKLCFENIDKLPSIVDNELHIKLFDLVTQTDEEKQQLQTMIKLFVSSDDVNVVEEALNYTLKDFKFDKINTVVLSFYQREEGHSDALLSNLLHMWSVMESFVEKGEVQDLGISDMDLDIFRKLYESVKIKPSVLHIKLDMCCVVPKDMQNFCQENNVRILTHSDPPEILSVEMLRPFFESKDDNSVSPLYDHIRVSWVTRLTSHIRCRGIISNKGYIIGLDAPKTV